MAQYFISYVHDEGFGNLVYETKRDIRASGDVDWLNNKIEQVINQKTGAEKVCILNFFKLDGTD